MHTPPQIDQDLLQQKISEMLERNGSLTDKEWKQLTTYMQLDMREDLKSLMPLKGEISMLKRKNIWMWIETHQKISMPIIVAFLLLFVVHTAEIVPILEKVFSAISKLLL